ncbi:MAG: FecR domain-containing protein [Deltaproteobacteria bacterium]|nr:FecR domain-containing protein [Deltaproteobacteria bacterium]
MSYARALVLLSLLASSTAAAETTARVSFLEGSATRSAKGQSSPLAQGDSVHLGDHVTTADKSRLELVLEDGSVLRVGPKSELEVQDLRFDASSSTLNARVMLLLGKVWSHVEHLSSGGTYEIATERAVAGVRGTEFRVDADPGNASVEVEKGKVAVASEKLAFAGEGPGAPGSAVGAGDAARHEVMVEPGQHLALADEGMKLFHQQRPADEFHAFTRRALPERDKLFGEHRREREERVRQHRERRQERLDRLRWRH